MNAEAILSFQSYAEHARASQAPQPASQPSLLRRCLGPVVTFAVATLVLLPAVLTVLEFDLVAMRDTDEWTTLGICMERAGDWGLFSMVPKGLHLGYGAPFWLLVGVPTVLFRSLEWDAAAIVAARLVSLLPYAAALAVVWWSARSAGVPRLPRLGLLALVALTPSLVANAIRVHPETLIYLPMVATVALLLEDAGRFGRWWWAGVAACGAAVAVKASTYSLGFVVFLYWFMQVVLRRDWRLALRTGLGAALLMPAVFFLLNFPLFVGDNFRDFRVMLRDSLASNGSNHGEGVAGLGWRTWVATSSQYFLWTPWACAIAALGAAAACLEVWRGERRPFALLGMAGWVGTFAATALLIKKNSWWNHYLIPAFAFFPFVVVGVYAALREHGAKPLVQGAAALCLGAFTAPQVWGATHVWFRHVTFEHEAGYKMAKANHAAVRQYLASLPHDVPLRLLKNWDLPIPMSAADGRGVHAAYVDSRSWDFPEHFVRHEPTVIVLFEWPPATPWLDPAPDQRPERANHPNLAQIKASSQLFQKAMREPVQIGPHRIRLERVLSDMRGWVAYRVHRT